MRNKDFDFFLRVCENLSNYYAYSSLAGLDAEPFVLLQDARSDSTTV